MFNKSLIAYALFAIYATAAASPHMARNAHRHRAVAARVAVPEPIAAAEPILVKLTKRGSSQRCRVRPSSATASSTAAAASATGSQVANAGADPATIVPAPATTPAPVTNTPAPVPATTVASSTETQQQQQQQQPPPPPPSTTQAPPPPPPAQTSQPANSGNSGNLPSFLVGTQTGDGTFYNTGLGACGITNNDSQRIAAVSHLLFDAFPGYNGVNPNSNPLCGRQVRAQFQGKETVVTLTDRCVACALTDLDFSPTAFDDLADPSVGRIHGMTWEWI